MCLEMFPSKIPYFQESHTEILENKEFNNELLRSLNLIDTQLQRALEE